MDVLPSFNGIYWCGLNNTLPISFVKAASITTTWDLAQSDEALEIAE